MGFLEQRAGSLRKAQRSPDSAPHLRSPRAAVGPKHPAPSSFGSPSLAAPSRVPRPLATSTSTQRGCNPSWDEACAKLSPSRFSPPARKCFNRSQLQHTSLGPSSPEAAAIYRGWEAVEMH